MPDPERKEDSPIVKAIDEAILHAEQDRSRISVLMHRLDEKDRDLFRNHYDVSIDFLKYLKRECIKKQESTNPNYPSPTDNNPQNTQILPPSS